MRTISLAGSNDEEVVKSASSSVGPVCTPSTWATANPLWVTRVDAMLRLESGVDKWTAEVAENLAQQHKTEKVLMTHRHEETAVSWKWNRTQFVAAQ